MKRLNNKAFTIVELIVTFALVMTISLGLFKVIDSYRQKQQRASYKKEMVNYKNEIIKVVKDDIYKYGLKEIRTNDEYRPIVPTSEKINQFINLSFKNGGGNKTLFFGQEGCSSHSNCTGKYYIKYGDIKYRVPNDFIRLEDDVIYSCDVKDQVETAKALIVNSSTYQVDSTKETYCRINFRMKHTEIKDEEVIRIAAWYLNSQPSSTTSSIPSAGTIPYRELVLNYINSSESRLSSLANQSIMTLKIPCSTTNPTVSKISDQVKGKLSNATLIIGSACTSIASEAFKNASIKALVFEPRNSGTNFEIGASAFEGVPLEGKVTLPDGLEKISKRAFYGNKLTRFIVPSSLVETVGGVKQTKFDAGELWNYQDATKATQVVVLK